MTQAPFSHLGIGLEVPVAWLLATATAFASRNQDRAWRLECGAQHVVRTANHSWRLAIGCSLVSAIIGSAAWSLLAITPESPTVTVDSLIQLLALTFSATVISFLLSARLPRPVTMLATLLWVAESYAYGADSLWSPVRGIEALLFPFTLSATLTDGAPIGPHPVPAWFAGGLFGAGAAAILAAAEADPPQSFG